MFYLKCCYGDDVEQQGLGTHDWAHLCSQMNKLRRKEIMSLTQSHTSSERADGTQPSLSSLCAVHKTVNKTLWNRGSTDSEIAGLLLFSLFTRH